MLISGLHPVTQLIVVVQAYEFVIQAVPVSQMHDLSAQSRLDFIHQLSVRYAWVHP